MDKPEKLTRQTPDGRTLNIEALRQLLPECFTEVRDPKTGVVSHAVDWDALREALGDDAAEGRDEMYQFTWVGKNDAKREAAQPTTQTLRPLPQEGESKDWATTQNVYIEGDNLQVLKLLQHGYMGRVKMIYIDPPYNTGGDFIYHDDFRRTAAEENLAAGNTDEEGNRFRKNTNTNGRFHSDWCSMIYARLLACRSLLTEDGVIFISIDDKEVANLIKICNEVLGEVNFVGDIIWQSRTSISNDDEISTNHNHTLVYSKNREALSFSGDDIDASEYQNPDNDERGPWKLVPIDANHVGGDTQYPIKNPKTGVEYLPPNGRCWCYNPKVMQELMDDGRIKFGLSDDSSPKRKLFYNERLDKGDCKTPSSILLDAGTTKSGTSEIMALFNGKKVFDYPKPTSLIKRLIQYGFIKENDIVLDFFSGSGTTADSLMQYAAEKEKLFRYILVQIPENLDETVKTANINAQKTIKVAIEYLDSVCKSHLLTELAKERIRRAGAKIKADNPLHTQSLDTGFRVFRLAESNFENVSLQPKDYSQEQLDLFADNIRADRTDMDLLFGAMLMMGVPEPLSQPVETIEADGKRIYDVAGGALVACFAEGVSADTVAAIAARHPLRVLFRDSCFKTDDQKINIFEQFKQAMDWTDAEAVKNIKVL